MSERARAPGKLLRGDAVLGPGRIGRVQCGAKSVPFGLRESNPAADQPLLPFSLGQVLDLWIGDYECLELIPVECPGFGFGAGPVVAGRLVPPPVRGGRVLRVRAARSRQPGHGRRGWEPRLACGCRSLCTRTRRRPASSLPSRPRAACGECRRRSRQQPRPAADVPSRGRANADRSRLSYRCSLRSSRRSPR
jgi:hypothetical protein